MPNDSSTGGYVYPDSQPAYDVALENIFQQALIGVVGVPGDLVRPSYQPSTPNQPEFNVDWLAFRLEVTDTDWDAHVKHDGALATGLGANTVSRDEQMELTLSFYGPNGTRNAMGWINGLSIDQNRWNLGTQGIKLQGHSKPVQLPALVKNQWVRRVDLKSQFARRSTLVYPIRSVVGVDVVINNERYITHVQVRQP